MSSSDSKILGENPDPMTGAPGAHPVGTGVGAAVGVIVGGLFGKGVAEGIDPTIEDTYWRENYGSRPYVAGVEPYERYRPAYCYGWESRARLGDRSWDEAESALSSGWATDPAADDLDWESARGAVRDAWDRVPMEPGKSPDKI